MWVHELWTWCNKLSDLETDDDGQLPCHLAAYKTGAESKMHFQLKVIVNVWIFDKT